ncbi:MAG TPA: c-type cytochrome [Steroidobacteraceae bacterium]|nr:c-type cytochrome [Steroidobacteraceae bacterium]
MPAASETDISATKMRDGRGRAVLIMACCAQLALGVAGFVFFHARHLRLEQRLLRASAETIAADPALIRFAVAEAKPLYAQHCASCHGADLHGNSTLGAPDLADRVWMYGNGGIYDIERTLLYGIRSGESRSRNVTEMPAFGLTGRLTPAQIRSAVQYVLQLSGRPYAAGAAAEGKELYVGAGGCYDCHGYDARGNSDYGAPDLTRNVWNSGGDPQSLYNALYFGQRRLMPAWFGPLNLVQIRSLAVYLYATSRAAPPAAAVKY